MELMFIYILLSFLDVVLSNSEEVAFLSKDKTLECNGSNVNWFINDNTNFRNQNPSKYQVEVTEIGSRFSIKNVTPSDAGRYRCLSDEFEKDFALKLYGKS